MRDPDTIWVTIKPPCCPDVYTCYAGEQPELECPRHGGFTVCCDRPEAHIPQDRKVWHQLMERYEQDLLNLHIHRFKILQAYELDDTPVADLLSTHI